MAEWRRRTIGELIASGALTMSDGYRTKRGELGQPGFRIIRVADVGDGTVALDSPDFVSESYRSQIGAKLGEAGDILLTTKGTVGRVAVLPAIDEPVVYSPQLCYFRVVSGGPLDRDYLRFWFRSAEFWSQARDRMNNTDMAAYVNLADVRSLQITLPPTGEQRAIAEVLGALDDKIAANTRLATTADGLASALYSSILTHGTQASLTTLADFVNGRAFTKDASGTGRVVVRIAELNSGIGGSTVYSDADVADQYLARPGDILFAWSGSLTLHRWFRSEAIVNQHIFKVVPRSGWPAWLVWHAIAGRLDYFKGVAADKATTMGHIQRHHLDEAVPVPPRDAVTRHDIEMATLRNRSLSAEMENLALAATRDALLPALTSGALRVRDALDAVKETAS